MVEQTGAAMANTLSEVAKDVSEELKRREPKYTERNFESCVY